MEMDKINECTGERVNLNLKVIGAGLSRTGTHSLKEALNILGFRCYHGTEMLNNKHADVWLDILSGKWEDVKSVLNGYNATVDMPSAAVYHKLMEECPEAKIILTVRDKERWYESIKNTLYRADKEPSNFSASEMTLMGLLIWEGLFHGRFDDREYAMGVFEAHVEAVKNDVPAHKLLVFNVNEGWAPLCDFLGVPLPPADTPFPHRNETQRFCKLILKNQ